MDRNYTLYMHIVPANLTGKEHDMYYIGATGRNVQDRWKVNGDGYHRGTVFREAIEQYGWKNIKHIIILRGLSKENAYYCEKRYIQRYKSNNEEYGFNRTIGGIGGNIKPVVPVIQYDLEGNFIRSWKSEAEAARHMGVIRSTITSATKNNATVKGYQFKKADAPVPGKYKKRTGINSTGPRPHCRGENNSKSKSVVLLNTGEVFPCLREACKKTGANICMVSKNCITQKGSSGRDQNRKRLVWRFYQDYICMTQDEINDAVEQAQHPNHR